MDDIFFVFIFKLLVAHLITVFIDEILEAQGVIPERRVTLFEGDRLLVFRVLVKAVTPCPLYGVRVGNPGDQCGQLIAEKILREDRERYQPNALFIGLDDPDILPLISKVPGEGDRVLENLEMQGGHVAENSWQKCP